MDQFRDLPPLPDLTAREKLEILRHYLRVYSVTHGAGASSPLASGIDEVRRGEGNPVVGQHPRAAVPHG